MKTSTQDLQRMASLLDEHITETRRMLDILHREQKALTSNDLASFEKSLELKQRQAATLDSLEKRTLDLGGINAAPLSMKNLVRLIEQSGISPLQSRWNTLQDLLRQCRQQNMVNHRIVEASRTHIRQSLDILHGKVSTPGTYVATGKTQIDASGHFLAVA